MHNHGKVFMEILLHPRKDGTFPKEEASAVSNKKLICEFESVSSEISRVNFFALKLIRKINGIPSSI